MFSASREPQNLFGTKSTMWLEAWFVESLGKSCIVAEGGPGVSCLTLHMYTGVQMLSGGHYEFYFI